MGKFECGEIIDKFIKNLEQVGQYTIKFNSKKPQIYIIDGKKINIRCTITPKLWYSVDLDVLPIVDCTIYLTSSPLKNPNYFLIFPSKYLKEIIAYNEMYESEHNNQTLKHFEIDWDGCVLVLKNGLLDVRKYAHDLDNPEYYPDFKKC